MSLSLDQNKKNKTDQGMFQVLLFLGFQFLIKKTQNSGNFYCTTTTDNWGPVHTDKKANIKPLKEIIVIIITYPLQLKLDL